ncbi:cupin domain-containing protein [Rhodohalobacter sp. 8-1]|uniref:cupin domain-containing protein n=1 Tax=Rhodohalobacter sp. 8-1 TaxID=3131972 RepID=UPI0030EDC632
MSRTSLTTTEKEELHKLIETIIQPTVYHFGADRTDVARYDKRENMYGGEGVVYLMQMFEDGDLVNNRIGAYMILPEKDASVGYHTHGTRNEQEVYLVISGEGEYMEKDRWESEPKRYPLQAGNLTTIRGEAFHSVVNKSEEPLVIFVITTNEP